LCREFKAAIFDLDGTLIDSMWVWDKIDQDYFSYHGLSVPQDLKNNINHLTFEETAIYFKKEYNILDSIDVILNTWNSMAFDHYTHNITLKKGALELLDYFKSSNIKIGLATSNSKTLLNAALKSTNTLHYFDCITTTDEVKKGKNNPDVYLLTAKKLGVPPTECIVFEDILEAVNGAKKAEMKVIAVHDKASDYQKEALIKAADNYINNFDELLISLSEKTHPQ
jgi:HAD superfamily hydrolase (TIGR01509 family)